MLKARHKNLHPVLKLIEWFALMLLCTLPVFIIWYALPFNHAGTPALLLFQAMQAVSLFIIPSFIVACLWSDEPLRWLHLAPADASRRPDTRLVLYSIAVMITAVPLINCLVAWNGQVTLPECLHGLETRMQQMEAQAEQLLQAFLTCGNGAWWMLLVNILVLAILPAVGEELTFRGVLQSHIFRFRSSAAARHLSVWLTAFVFSFVHFQFYGFIPRFLLGALLGYALVWTGQLGYSMLMHATNNALSVILFYLGTYVFHLSQSELDALGTQHTWWLTALFTPLMLLFLYLIYRRTHPRT